MKSTFVSLISVELAGGLYQLPTNGSSRTYSILIISVILLTFKSSVRFVAFLAIHDFDLCAVSLVTNEHNRKLSGVDNITMLALWIDYAMLIHL